MGRTLNNNDALLDAVRVARMREREATQIAKKELQLLIEKNTRKAHADVVSAVRSAIIGGQSARQIGIAYGSSDPHTIRKLIAEASVDLQGGTSGHPDWMLNKYEDGTFQVQVMSLGDTGLSGSAVFKIDDDGDNFTAIDGDLWVQVQLYRMGYKDAIMEEYRKD